MDGRGIVRWIYESEFGHMRMTPTDLFDAMERLTLHAQNRELRRTRSVGKVVRQVFLMDKPDDLGLAIDVMQGELARLGLRFSVCGVAILDESVRTMRVYSTVPSGGLATREIAVESKPEVEKVIAAWREGRTTRLRFAESSDEKDDDPMAPLDWLVAAPFSHGVLFIADEGDNEPPEDDVATLMEFADAISAAFQRFADFRELEHRNRMLQETQVQLIQSEKMASLGQLVAGVAHELNTPIGAIQSNAQTERTHLERLASTLDDGGTELADDARESAGRTVRALLDLNGVTASASRRVAEIVGNLRKFARLDESEWKPADLHEGLEETLALVRHKTRDRITIERDYGDVPPVNCYAGQLNQVFMNLIVNGIQAIEGKGTIRIETRADDESVRVRISDDGAGIPEDDLGRVFDPGFTTKGVGVGTGLGLSISYRIVSNHGGTLTAESRPGEGSVFTVTIPRNAAPPEPASPSARVGERHGRRLSRVLSQLWRGVPGGFRALS